MNGVFKHEILIIGKNQAFNNCVENVFFNNSAVTNDILNHSAVCVRYLKSQFEIRHFNLTLQVDQSSPFTIHMSFLQQTFSRRQTVIQRFAKPIFFGDNYAT